MAIGKHYIGITEDDRQIVYTDTAWPFTPDLHRIERSKHLLFVYDEYSSDRHQSFVLEGLGEKLTKAFSKDRCNFLLRNQPFEPPASVCLLSPSGCRVLGELWSVDHRALLKLDKLKMNGLKSLRHRVSVLYPFRYGKIIDNGYFTEDGYELPEVLQGKKQWLGPERIWQLESWMYVAHPSYWTDMVHDNPFWFNRVPTFSPKKDKPWLDEYYRYQDPT